MPASSPMTAASASVVARLDHVSKAYRLGVERSNWRSLIPGRLGEERGGEQFLALRDVSLEIGAGRAVGIIGENGAGKSTILKLLSGIVRPTSGRVDLARSTAAVIELGVGFNPELSGRDNLRFGAGLLGITPNDVAARFDDIVEFAGLERFIDTPLKRYSTGMRARLGFALVSSFEAELVLLDEVLSVGDWAFQRRSLERIRELHRAGASLVAVSHSNWMIAQICDELVLLEHGEIVAQGEPIMVIGHYTGSETIGVGEEIPDDQIVADLIADPPPDSPVVISGLELLPSTITPGDPVRFRFTIQVERPVDGHLMMSIYTLGRAVFAEPEEGPSEVLRSPGTHEVKGTIRSVPIAPGSFHLRVAAIEEHSSVDYHQEYLASWAVATVPLTIDGPYTSRPGLRFETDWAVDA